MFQVARTSHAKTPNIRGNLLLQGRGEPGGCRGQRELGSKEGLGGHGE